MNIDQSIKVSSWGNEAFPNRAEASHQIFQKYSLSQKNTLNGFEFEEEFKSFPTDEAQPNSIQSGFRKLKNEQIQKLKDLKNEYEEIRKITTDYAPPRGSRTPSMHSSSQSQSQAVLSPQGSKLKNNSNREVQILQLEKKQLEIMIENSMKKIEELLHNEMQFKKTIHELKLQRQNKNSNEVDNETLAKLLKRKEKDFNERLKVLEIERETFFSTVATYKDRIKYLESSLTTSEQELRKILDEKRNFEELIRMEKDRFMNLQIEFRREKREHEIIEKDKTSEINRMLKLKDVKESSLERELKNKISDLQEEIKVKDERYTILLEKFETYQKQEKERLREEKEKENEIKTVNEIMSKSSSVQPQNKVFHQTITSILDRLKDLEKKPLAEIQPIIHHQQEDNSAAITHLQSRISQLLRAQDERDKYISDLKSENQRLTTFNQKLERELKNKGDRESELEQEMERLKRLERSFKKDKSVERFNEFKVKSQAFPIMPSVNNDQVRQLQFKIANLSKDIELITSEKSALEDENRQLRLYISKLEFQVDKKQKQKQFTLLLQERTSKSTIDDLNNCNSQLKLEISKLGSDLNLLKLQTSRNSQLKAQEIQQLTQIIENFKRERNTADTLIKENTYASVNKMRSEGNLKLNELSTTIQNLTLENERFRQERQECLAVLEENERLLDLLKQTRNINGECDRLWSAKELEYEKIDSIIRAIRR